MSNFDDDLREDLKDPECAAYFANAQVESARELLRCGVITELNETSNSNETLNDSYLLLH